MDAFELADVAREQRASARPYLEFINVPDLSVGLYVLPAGGVDGQSEHLEDEVYYVVSGEARVTVGDDERPVRAGSIVFVGAHVEHRFHHITEDLTLFVAFGPAEGSRSSA